MYSTEQAMNSILYVISFTPNAFKPLTPSAKDSPRPPLLLPPTVLSPWETVCWLAHGRIINTNTIVTYYSRKARSIRNDCNISCENYFVACLCNLAHFVSTNHIYTARHRSRGHFIGILLHALLLIMSKQLVLFSWVGWYIYQTLPVNKGALRQSKTEICAVTPRCRAHFRLFCVEVLQHIMS